MIPPSVEVGGNGEDGEDEEPGFMGAKVTPHIPKPDMTLTDTSGDDYNIQEETEGYLTLLYFGYTNCPDICPTHMQDISSVMADMSEEQREKIKLVFVTTDPEN
ncbi:MAG: SCO family protein [Dehalococcoidia bacterium]|nr:SCO family protein [Dehalococcoidia bacterium]